MGTTEAQLVSLSRVEVVSAAQASLSTELFDRILALKVACFENYDSNVCALLRWTVVVSGVALYPFRARCG
jgi:hypothetical protein